MENNTVSDRALDSEYDIEAATPDADRHQARFLALSIETAKQPGAALDVAYGPDPRHKLDIFATEAQRQPAIVFFHGGYWRAGSKETRRFPAEAWTARGVAWISVEYRLAPDARLDDIISDARRALAWVHANATRFRLDPGALHAVGNSAGAHLVAMLAATDWIGDHDLPDTILRSATVVSGVFDLTPLRKTFANDWLSLDDAAARRNSPLNHLPRAGLPMLVSVGGQETQAFRDQTRTYADACTQAGVDVTYFERPESNHLSIIGEFAEPASPLFQALEKMTVPR